MSVLPSALTGVLSMYFKRSPLCARSDGTMVLHSLDSTYLGAVRVYVAFGCPPAYCSRAARKLLRPCCGPRDHGAEQYIRCYTPSLPTAARTTSSYRRLRNDHDFRGSFAIELTRYTRVRVVSLDLIIIDVLSDITRL